MLQPSLKTERLILRPLQMSDAPDIERYAGDRAIAATTQNIPHPYEPGMAEKFIEVQASLLPKKGWWRTLP